MAVEAVMSEPLSPSFSLFLSITGKMSSELTEL